MPLEKYRSMRDFTVSPEPAGVDVPTDQRRFVIQEHHARALHWDHRFEHEGVLLSFAVPKGLPPDPRVNHLAVHTEDHPIEYLDFDGDIPQGEYGGGSMTIWDRGTYDLEKMNERELIVTFHGERARGKYVLFRTRGTQWMIHRMDPAEDPDRELLPDAFAPAALEVRDAPPDGGGWLFEPAWGGVRANVGIDGGRVAWAVDESGAALGDAFPELPRVAAWQDVTPAVLEVELIVVDDGRPAGDLLDARRQPGLTKARAQRLATRHPATTIISDVAWRDGHALDTEDYASRHTRLLALPTKGPTWMPAPAHDDGQALLEAVRAQGLAGIRGRRATGDRVYVPASPRSL